MRALTPVPTLLAGEYIDSIGPPLSSTTAEMFLMRYRIDASLRFTSGPVLNNLFVAPSRHGIPFCSRRSKYKYASTEALSSASDHNAFGTLATVFDPLAHYSATTQGLAVAIPLILVSNCRGSRYRTPAD